MELEWNVVRALSISRPEADRKKIRGKDRVSDAIDFAHAFVSPTRVQVFSKA